MSNSAIFARATLGFFLVASLSGTVATNLFSQATHAIVLGTVTDGAGAVVQEVSIRVKSLDTSVTQSTVTDGAGQYRVGNLSIGNYEVEAAISGFRTIVRRPVTLGVSGSVFIDFSLEVGSSQETIFVEASVPLVETHSPALSSISTFDEKQLRNLPLNGRSLLELITMNPGVTATMGAMPVVAVSAGGGIMATTIDGAGEHHSVSGARAEGSTVLLDNTNIQGFWNRGAGSGAVGSWLGVEGIAGIQVLTSSYGAQFGGNGSVVNLVTKRGTNGFHGSVYEFLRNSVFNARNFFDATTDPLPSRSNQFGASLGGPIHKEKLLFFFNYEGLRRAQNESMLAFVPGAGIRQGILPALSAPITINPTIKPILDLYPLPNGGSLPNGAGEYRSSADALTRENYFLGRVDWVISPKDSLFARFISDRGDSLQPYAGSVIPGWPGQEQTANNYFTLEERRVISRTLINALRFGFVRPVETGRNLGRHDALQFLNLGRDDVDIWPGGVSSIGSSWYRPFALVQNRFTYADDATWVHGGHSFQLGASVEKIQSNTNISYLAAGFFAFGTLQNFLRGTPTSFNGVPPEARNGSRDFREVAVAPYFQDEWRLRAGFTLNLGLRYEYGSNPVGVRHPLYTFLNPPNGTLEQVTNVFKSSPNKKNWDPRFGFAWDPFKNHKTSVRGGFGIFHDRVAARTYFQAFTGTPPYSFGRRSSPSFPNPFTTPTLPSTEDTLNGLLYDLKQVPYQMEWSLSLQREILNGVITLGYVGSRGVHLLVSRDLNPPKPVLGADGLARYGTSATPAGVTPNPRINPSYSSINVLVPDSNSNYNSLQLSFDRRVTRQINAMLSYTWSKCIDNGSVAFSFEEQAGKIPFMPARLSNPYDARGDRGLCAQDRRHSFRGGTMISLPFQRNRFVDGWMISAIVMADSGQPFSLNDGFDQSGFGDSSFVPSRPDAVAGCNAILGSVDRWYEPTCFRLQPAGRPGNLGRNTLQGPGFFTADIALIKDIKLRESASVQFRAEAFNVLNHPNFRLPDPNLFLTNGNANPTAGRITTTTTSARQIQFGVKILF